MPLQKSQLKGVAIVLASLILYLVFAYDLDRGAFLKLLSVYSALFLITFAIITYTNFSFRQLVFVSFIFRLSLLLALPNLSQDFFRFIWDGQLILEGINPYLFTPNQIFEKGILPLSTYWHSLYEGMGPLSAMHFSNYPPLNQFCFAISAFIGGKSLISTIVAMRVIIICADLGILYFGSKLLERLEVPRKKIFWYLLNPFIIIELTGNLHFEGVMLFFLIWSLYLLHKGYWKWAALLLAFSISIKLIPLMFMPLFFWWFFSQKAIKPFKRLQSLIVFYLIIMLTTLGLFAPFLSRDFLSNYLETISLWFNDFEFNASIYYILRRIGYSISGYNEIAFIGKILPLITLGCIIILSFFRKNGQMRILIGSMLLAISTYLFLSTTVHPWYIVTLILLGTLTDYKFPLIWSVVIIFSYLAYGNIENKENLTVIALEYAIVYMAFIWEVILKRPITAFDIKSRRTLI